MPLTTTGIAIQILASIRAQRANDDHCTKNDCKVVVSQLIRKFSEPLRRAKQDQVRMSLQASANASVRPVKDHAVPVLVLLEELLRWPDSQIEVTHENARRVEEFLRRSLLIVKITPEEDRLLSNKGYQQVMPPCWSDQSHPWYRDPLARYKECGIELEQMLGADAAKA